MLPLLCRGLNLENIFLDSEENMKVPISRFSRQVVMQVSMGESLGVSPHQGLPSKAAVSQSFCRSYAYACSEIQQKPCDLFLANTWSPEAIFCTLLWGCKPCYTTNLQHLLCQTQQSCRTTTPAPDLGLQGRERGAAWDEETGGFSYLQEGCIQHGSMAPSSI